jgi:dipeptidyl aminopeptidase/acylaminoacyl peptidase
LSVVLQAYTIPFPRQFVYAVPRGARCEAPYFSADPIRIRNQRTKTMLRELAKARVFLTGFFVFAALLPGPRTVRADEVKPSVKKEPWKAEDFIYAETANQFRISPDAKWVVWVKSSGDKEKDARVSNLILSSLTQNREIPLTRGTDTVSQPRWSPDGEWIAFLSTRARPKPKPDTAPMQIWLINSAGGEPWPLMELAHEPKRIEWLDKDTLLYSAEEDPAFYEQEMKRKKDDSEIVDDAEHTPPVRLYQINVKDRKVTRLTTNTDWIEDFGVSRDGKYIAAAHAKSLHYTFDQRVRPVVMLHDLSNGREKQLFADVRIQPEGFEWAPDNSGFYMPTPYSTDPRFMMAGITIVYFYDVASGKATQIDLQNESGLGRDLQTVPGGFLALLAAGSHDQFAFHSAEKGTAGWSWKRQDIAGDHAKNIESFHVSEDGKTIVYSYSTASKLSQPYRAQLDGSKLTSPVQFAKLNEGLVNGRAYAKSEIIRWKGSNDDEVEGILYYPTNYDAGKKYPLITAIHGGPLGADHDLWGESWAYPIQLFTQRGAFVLRPNYHGSSSYGLKFAESICCGKYYDLETPDINAGVDYLISQGTVDADRVATMGWSNGSILSTSLITTYPSRYKAASVGAGDIEWISDWGNVMFGDSFDSYYFGKSPMEDPQLYIKKSPFFKMDKVQAPVLIFHGTADTNVPPDQSWSYFRVLQYYGKVPVKFVVFQGEPHGPRKLTHQMRKVEEESAWFDKYFFKTAKPENEAVKKDSPLAAGARRDHAKKDERGAYGELVLMKLKTMSVGILAPETVKQGDIDIGKFEVTQGQFSQYQTMSCMAETKTSDAHKCVDLQTRASNTHNLPQSSVTLQQSQAYVAWLSFTTKQQWRLPYEDEVKDLYANRENENTLDYWAGYAPNPEDNAKLREKAKELTGAAPLLREVGSFVGKGKDDEEPIYDLGGNVAEWVLTRDGKGKVMGGSADCPADPKSNCTPAPEYVGFRVVRGAAKPLSPSP